nr:putative peptidoglycan glycosyltransferase FtsW [Bifidobacterium choloepi]
MLLNPLWCYHGFRVSVLVLTVFGVVMVFSSSAASNVASGLSPWATGLNQSIFCVIGLVVALIAMHVPYRVYDRFSVPIMLIAIFMQFLTRTPLGVEVNGNRSWISIAGITIQPAEILKLAVCMWLPGAMLHAAKVYAERTERKWLAYAMPLGIYAAALLGVLVGKDLGTALIIIGIGVVGFLVGGFPLKWMLAAGGVLALGVLVLVLVSPNRLSRITAAYQTCSAEDIQGVCYQATHAKYAIASGGLLGVGIGNSREKWSYLPEAHNDFIYAIIGEETGFVGAFAVLLLFVIVGWCMLVIATKMHNRYVSMVLILLTTWICGQAFINIGVVVGLLPVMGVPMPFVSAGGSSLVMCLLGAGVADSMMRAQPEVRAERNKL